MRLLFSSILLLLAWRFRYAFPIAIPHLQYAGFFLMGQGVLTYKESFLINFADFIFLMYFFVRYRAVNFDRCSFLMFLIGISVIPVNFIGLFYDGNPPSALMLSLMILMMPYYYLFLKENFGYISSSRIMNMIVLSLILAGMVEKLYQGIVHGPVLAPYMNPIMYGLISRGGGMNASNHIGAIILFMLPFVKDIRVRVLVIGFLLLTFSRGIYALTILFLLVEYFLSRKEVHKKPTWFNGQFVILIAVSALLLMADVLMSDGSVIIDEFFSRLKAFGAIEDNVRFGIFAASIQMAKDSFFMGIGPGNFYYHSISSDYAWMLDDAYSNAHNLYLTILVECGFLFTCLFLYLLYYSMKQAFNNNLDAFLSLSLFVIYGLFSGQLYEAGMGKSSVYDYFYLTLIFVFAHYHKVVPGNPPSKAGQTEVEFSH